MSDAAEKPCPACDKGQKRACTCRGKRSYKPRVTKAARAAFSRDTPPLPVGGGGGGASAAEGNMVFVSFGAKQPFTLEKYTRPEPQRAPVRTTTATNSAPVGHAPPLLVVFSNVTPSMAESAARVETQQNDHRHLV